MSEEAGGCALRLEMEVLGCYCLPNPKTQYYQRSNSSISANTAETQIGGINGKIATPNWEGKNERRLMRRVDGYEGRVLASTCDAGPMVVRWVM